MTSRDDFIAQLIAALQENEALANSASESAVSGGPESASIFSLGARTATNGSPTSTDALARQAYDALQYDFPVVDDAQLVALVSTYRAIIQGETPLSEARQFPLTAKMIEGIDYLNDSLNQRRGTEASSLLAAAVLLLVPRFCIAFYENPVSSALLRELYPPLLRPPASQEDQQAKIERYTQSMEATAGGEAFSSGFAEVYAAEEDPDDLSLVYEGSIPSRPAPSATTTSPSVETMPQRSEQLRFLASKTYSTCFSLISSDKWTEWQIDDALCDLSRRLLETDDQSVDDAGQRVFGVDGEWQRYLFVLRDQLLRFSESSDACAGGLAKLKALVADPKTATSTAPTATSSDPFFSFSKQSSSIDTSTKDTTERVRILFRIFAELAVSKEFNSVVARQSQHALASTIQQLFPIILRELQSLAKVVSQPTFEAENSDFVIVLLQLLHFLVDAAGVTAASQQMTIDKLQDSGLLRTWLSFLPPLGTSQDWPWMAPLLRLLGESALWNADVAAYVHRVPKVTKVLETAQQDNGRLSCEALLLLIAGLQQNILLHNNTSATVWAWFTSEHIFPSSCQSFIESMEKMSDAVFLLDALAKAITTLRPPVANEVRTSLQFIYSTRFTTAFQYPNFTIPAPQVDVPESLNKDEPEPPPKEERRVEEEKHDEEEERGRAEALQFQALRNRLRQCAKTILLSRMAGASSSKLD